MSLTPRVRCLGAELSEYVAGRLPAEREWEWDRHLVACRVCGHAVDSERRIRSALAGGPSMPGDLRTTLLALGSSLAAEAPDRPAPPAPAVQPLALLAPSAPPCHRSPLRATVVAAAAAGVSAAAAVSLTVIGAPPVARPALATTTVPSVAPASAPTTATMVSARLEVRSAAVRPASVVRQVQRAQSTP